MLVAVLLWFLGLNVDQNIQELQLFTLTMYNVNLVHVILASFLIGVLIGFFIPVLQVLSARTEAKRFERENRKLRQELNDLRNVSIEEELEQLPESTPAEEIDEETENPVE